MKYKIIKYILTNFIRQRMLAFLLETTTSLCWAIEVRFLWSEQLKQGSVFDQSHVRHSKGMASYVPHASTTSLQRRRMYRMYRCVSYASLY